MKKAKLYPLAVDRIRRQHVKQMLKEAEIEAHRSGAQGAILIMSAADGRTIIKTAGTLHKRDLATLKLLKVGIHALTD